MAKRNDPDRSRPRGEINVFIDLELHRRLKTYAAYSGVSMTRAVEELIEEGVPEMRAVHVAATPGRETHAA